MPKGKNRYESWGRYPRVKHAGAVRIQPGARTLPFQNYEPTVLAYAQGRSYGDSCLNENGILLDTSLLTGVTAFDETSGVLRCDAGTTLAQILDLIVPRGWFLPVTPGTKHVSIGGAIAHDVHGKNHHRVGTFGSHVRQFELLRSSGERLLCSPSENVDLYRATIAGMGLTGIILWAEFQLKPITNPFIEVDRVPFASLEEFFALSKASDQDYEYTVAWLDGTYGRELGRGVLMRGNHVTVNAPPRRKKDSRSFLRVPFDAPGFLLNRMTIAAFNSLYYKMQVRAAKGLIFYEPFFYPLDALSNWNRIYGRRGFLQYQCVLPYAAEGAPEEILRRIRLSRLAPTLAVLKTFGDVPSPGMLSFPRPGITLAIDFPFLGKRTLKLFEDLDDVTRGAKGAVYPAKDACMSAQSFQAFFPQWQNFARFIDPKFSSSFWRRVTARD